MITGIKFSHIPFGKSEAVEVVIPVDRQFVRDVLLTTMRSAVSSMVNGTMDTTLWSQETFEKYVEGVLAHYDELETEILSFKNDIASLELNHILDYTLESIDEEEMQAITINPSKVWLEVEDISYVKVDKTSGEFLVITMLMGRTQIKTNAGRFCEKRNAWILFHKFRPLLKEINSALENFASLKAYVSKRSYDEQHKGWFNNRLYGIHIYSKKISFSEVENYGVETLSEKIYTRDYKKIDSLKADLENIEYSSVAVYIYSRKKPETFAEVPYQYRASAEITKKHRGWIYYLHDFTLIT